MLRPFLALALLLANSASFSFEVAGSYWREGEAVFHVGLSGTAPSGTSWNESFTQAMSEWSELTPFTFSAVQESLDPCTDREGLGGFGEGVTGVGFSTTVCGTEFSGNTLAVTLSSGNCPIFEDNRCIGAFQFNEADIVFNSNEAFDVYSGAQQFDQAVDFQRVALHELGHALGLGHAGSGTPAIMQAFINANDGLLEDDIAGANSIYGPPDTNNSIYKLPIIESPNSSLSAASESISLHGSLENSDGGLNGKFLDIYEFTFLYDSNIEVWLSSDDFDSFLYLARVNSTQDLIDAFVFTDDNSGSGSDSKISQTIQAGTYWIAVSSSRVGELGHYDAAFESTRLRTSSSQPRFTSIYDGAEVEINPNSKILGSLGSGDFQFENKFVDLYQFEVPRTTAMKFDLSSTNIDTKLLVLEILPDQALGNLMLENDDISASNSNSSIEHTLAPGTYWIGVTSFGNQDFGDYDVAISVVLD